MTRLTCLLAIVFIPVRGQVFGMMFSGAKLALFMGPDLLVIQRDDKPSIPYPGFWDLPGGGREGDETPAECALRETQEEVGLILAEEDLIWARNYSRPRGQVWFFAAHLPGSAVQHIRFGSEGQGWRLMDPQTYIAHPLAVPHFTVQIQAYLEDTGFGGKEKSPAAEAGAR